MHSMIFKNYIDTEGEEAIRNFKYKGGSSGISYEYLWSPLAQYILKYVPIWWAPNAITLVGFLLVLLGEIIIYGFGRIGDDISSIRILVFALCIFVYQNLDNLDGKQARRTKTSTPLGMLFDHGCDSMSCYFLANCVCRIVGVTDERFILYVTLLGVMFGFYFSVWAQYHSGGIMHLGKVNAVDDGIPAVWMIALFTTYTGIDYWQKNHLFGVQYNTWLVIGIILSGVLQIVSLLFNTGENFTKDIKGALKHFYHILCITLSLTCIVLFTDWWLYDKYFNAILFSLGFMYVRNITYMQLCVTTCQEYNQFTTAIKVFSIGFPVYILLVKVFHFNTIVPEGLFIYGLTLFFVLNYIHFVISVIVHMSDILNIKPFSIRNQLRKQGLLGAEKDN